MRRLAARLACGVAVAAALAGVRAPAARRRRAVARNGVAWRRRFDDLFRGDFDNYDQVAAERRRGVAAADGDGHEHVHCCLRRVPAAAAPALVGAGAAEAAERVLLACYYLDAAPARVFRLRCYALDAGGAMALFRPPLGALDAAHAACADLPRAGAARACAGLADLAAATGAWERLGGCEVFWRPVGGGAFEGTMGDGRGCVIRSQADASRTIRVEDSLRLSADALQVDDRGYALDGTLLYGSPDGGPYDLRRVERGGPLAWTTGRGDADDVRRARLAALDAPA